MARLPTAEALGVVNNAGSGGPMSSIQSSAMSEGISSLARSGARFGAVLSEIGDREDAFNTRIATSTATANLLKEHNAFEQRMRENPDNWQNYEKEYNEGIAQAKQRSAALIQDPRQRALWEAQNEQTIEGWRQRVKATARTRHNDAFLGQTQADVNELRNIALDPNTPEEERALHIETVAGMIEDARRRGVINDTQAEQWASKWREGYAVKRVEMMPAKERAMSLSSIRHATPELSGAIKASAERLGIDPVDLATVISYETAGTFDPWKAGPTTQWGQHRGLIQWGEPQRKKYGVYEGMPVAEQLKAVEAYMKDAGVKPGMKLLDVYSAVNAGSVGRYNASDAGNGGAPGTVADKVNNQMGAHRRKAIALMGGQSVDPVAEMIPPDQRERMLTRANAEVEREAESEKFNVRRLVADDTSGLLAVGRGVENLSYDRVKDALGKDEADKWQASRTIAQQTFENTRGMDDMTDEQLRQHSERFRPKETDAGEGFSSKAQIYQNVQTKAQEIITKRATDPAQSVDDSAPVRAAKQAAAADNNLANREAVIAARLQQQELFGVPAYNRSPITIEEAKSYAAKMRPLARGQADVANQNQVIEGIVNEIEQTYGKYSKEVLQRVLYQVTLKRDAAEVLTNAISRMRTTDAGPLVTTEENRKLEQGQQAKSIADMSGGFDPGDYGMGVSSIDPPEQKFPVPPLKAVQMLESDPAKYLPFFIQKYGTQAIPRSLRFGPHADEQYVPPRVKR